VGCQPQIRCSKRSKHEGKTGFLIEEENKHKERVRNQRSFLRKALEQKLQDRETPTTGTGGRSDVKIKTQHG